MSLWSDVVEALDDGASVWAEARIGMDDGDDAVERILIRLAFIGTFLMWMFGFAILGVILGLFGAYDPGSTFVLLGTLAVGLFFWIHMGVRSRAIEREMKDEGYPFFK